ncbi:MAG TPA: Holliday junction branch migration protein RuvA, partial [Roseiarcus sp.]|nr:Holliday junction branch migration protein RuvA [Roseiarcus sp.]
AHLPRPGEPATLAIETQVREDAIRLFGFLNEPERDWFRLLQSVQGVGAKVALALLSTLSADALASAVAGQDKAMVARAPGVGPKLAARIVAELKDRAPACAAAVAISAGPPESAAAPSAARDAISALCNLGYGRPQAQAAINASLAALGPEADASTLIRRGLKELAQ